MRVKYFYKLHPELNRPYACIDILCSKPNEPLVLDEYDRYLYYLVGPVDWWFPQLEDLTKTLKKLEELELGKRDVVDVCTSDAFIEISLEGAQASNLSDDSVTDQPEGRFTYQEVKTIFLKYKEFLEMPVSLDSTLEFEL